MFPLAPVAFTVMYVPAEPLSTLIGIESLAVVVEVPTMVMASPLGFAEVILIGYAWATMNSIGCGLAVDEVVAKPLMVIAPTPESIVVPSSPRRPMVVLDSPRMTMFPPPEKTLKPVAELLERMKSRPGVDAVFEKA